jgi:hypothetical protein
MQWDASNMASGVFYYHLKAGVSFDVSDYIFRLRFATHF